MRKRDYSMRSDAYKYDDAYAAKIQIKVRFVDIVVLPCRQNLVCPVGRANADFHRQPSGVGDEGGGPQAS